MNVTYSIDTYLTRLKLKGISETDLPADIQNLIGKFRNEVSQKEHNKSEAGQASDELVSVVKKWYNDVHSEKIDQVAPASCGCNHDKVLAKFWNAGHREVYKTELQKAGYTCGSWSGLPTKCETKNFKLKPINKKGLYKLEKI